MPSLEAFIKYSELLFCFDYNVIIEQIDCITDLFEQIEYLLFAISEANRVINIFNHFVDRVISLGDILEIKPMLETCFLASLYKFMDNKSMLTNSITISDQLDLRGKTECELYNYIDRVKVSLSLLETELHYRKNLAAILPSENKYTPPQLELFIKDKSLIPRIKWLRTERQLLKLFSLLNENKFLEAYDAGEIINHFSILNSGAQLKLFCTSKIKFLWHGSDNEFCFLVNQLVKKKLIPAHKKYKITGDHFLNREGRRFIYLAQKHNFTKNYLQTKALITNIVNSIIKPD